MPRHLALLLILLTALVACGRPGEDEQRRRSVVAAAYPLEFLAQEVAADLADVTPLTPDGVAPHGLQVTTEIERTITQADVFLHLSGGFQPEVEELVTEMEHALDLRTLEYPSFIAGDPHAWLDPVWMVLAAQALAGALAEADPGNSGAYRENAENLAERIHAVDDAIQNGLALCARRQIVTSHHLFAYLAERFNLAHLALAGPDPSAGVTPGRVTEAQAFVRRHGLTTVFYDREAGPGPVEQLAGDGGLRMEVLDALVTAPPTGDYLSVMRTNLRALRDALECR